MHMDKTTSRDEGSKQVGNALDAAWQAFLDRAAGPGDRYDQIRALGGMAKAHERWRNEVTAS